MNKIVYIKYLSFTFHFIILKGSYRKFTIAKITNYFKLFRHYYWFKL